MTRVRVILRGTTVALMCGGVLLAAAPAAGSAAPPIAGPTRSIAGRITEFPVKHPPGHYIFLGGIATGPDGALWFTEAAAQNIGRIDRG